MIHGVRNLTARSHWFINSLDFAADHIAMASLAYDLRQVRNPNHLD